MVVEKPLVVENVSKAADGGGQRSNGRQWTADGGRNSTVVDRNSRRVV